VLFETSHYPAAAQRHPTAKGAVVPGTGIPDNAKLKHGRHNDDRGLRLCGSRSRCFCSGCPNRGRTCAATSSARRFARAAGISTHGPNCRLTSGGKTGKILFQTGKRIRAARRD